MPIRRQALAQLMLVFLAQAALGKDDGVMMSFNSGACDFDLPHRV